MDKQAFADQIIAMERMMYCIAKTILSADADCADAVQEAILRAWKHRSALRQERYFRTWVTRILINEARKIAKRCPLETLPQTLAWEPPPMYGALYAALFSLDNALRLPIMLHYIEGFSLAEIASMMRIPQGTVKSRLHKGRNVLMTKLDEKEADA